MKNIFYLGIALFLFGTLACSEDENLGEIKDWKSEYTLPQGGNADADAVIMQLHQEYGCYFLYDYTYYDFHYDITSRNNGFVLPDPEHVDEMLNFLNQVWLQFYPKEFLKKHLPYRVLLAKDLYTTTSNSDVKNGGKDIFLGARTVALGFCSDTVLTESRKVAYKRSIHKEFWTYWIEDAEILEIPEAFFNVSDYTTKPNTTVTSPQYVRTRGFVKDDANNREMNANTTTWPSTNNDTNIQKRKMNDFWSYLYDMIYRTDADWAADLEYPLIKQKYDIIVNHFKDQYGIDITTIGNTPIE